MYNVCASCNLELNFCTCNQLNYNDLVEVEYKGLKYKGKILAIGSHNPFYGHVMIDGFFHWFKEKDCKLISPNVHKDNPNFNDLENITDEVQKRINLLKKRNERLEIKNNEWTELSENLGWYDPDEIKKSFQYYKQRADETEKFREALEWIYNMLPYVASEFCDKNGESDLGRKRLNKIHDKIVEVLNK